MQQPAIGKNQWVIPGGNIPLNSTGHEPEFTSADKLSMLNTQAGTTEISLTIYFEDREALGPYTLKVEGRRMKQVRFNDLIDPLAIPLGVPFACVLTSEVPIVVQFTRQDTTQAGNAECSSIAFPVTDE